ncbi:MAG: nickel-dependent hydrogenase large subunit [Thermoanaerobaculaceae bacterium]
MGTTLTIDPVSRLEGHLKIEVLVDTVNGKQRVVDAWATGTLFRGFERLLVNRDPWDAQHITQRICGVCPVSHGMASVLAQDAASGVAVPANARIMRNLVLGSNFVQSHILHFYHLALLDYVDGPGMAPWQPSWAADKRFSAAVATRLVNHYVTALELRRKAHEAGALFGGKLPHPPAFIPGGFTAQPNAARVAAFRAYMDQLTSFISGTYLQDVEALAHIYYDYATIGRGPGNLLAFGVFDLDASGQNKLLRRGRVTNGARTVQSVDIQRITEQVTYSWYDDADNDLQPAQGETVPVFPKGDAYSWLKAPRYAGQPYEVGPLARMWVNGDYQRGISVLDRHRARGLEALKVAKALKGWVEQLQIGAPVHVDAGMPTAAQGYGLTEAPRGALGHWLEISGSKISRYQVVTPTCWNASPRDGGGRRGPVEQALIGTPVQNQAEPIEVLRVIHSFDPCLSCAVHLARPAEGSRVFALGLPGAQVAVPAAQA